MGRQLRGYPEVLDLLSVVPLGELKLRLENRHQLENMNIP